MEENKNQNVVNQNQDELEEDLTKNISGDFYYPLPSSSLENTLKNINSERIKFYEYINNSNRLSKIVLFTFLGVFFIFAIVLLMNQNYINQLFSPLIFLFFIFIIVSYFLVKSNKKKRLVFFEGYKYQYFLNIDSYCYYQTGISHLQFASNGKIELDEVKNISCYDNLIQAVTRDVVVGKMFGTNFKSYDLLLKSGKNLIEKKSQSTLFSGKMFFFDLPLNKNEKVIIYLRGCGDSYPTELKGFEPRNVNGLKEGYQVFSTNEKLNIFTSKVIESLNHFNIDKVVEDLIISISNQGIFIGFSLTKDYMTIPYDNEVSDEFLIHYKNDIELVKNFISILMSNNNFKKLK